MPQSLKDALRASFSRTVILVGGFSGATAEADLEAGRGDLIAFGRPFISNPALVAKLRTGAELRAADFGTFYTPGPEGDGTARPTSDPVARPRGGRSSHAPKSPAESCGGFLLSSRRSPVASCPNTLHGVDFDPGVL